MLRLNAHNKVSEDVVSDSKHAIEFSGDRWLTGEIHEDVDAFATASHLVSEASLVPSARRLDLTSLVSYKLGVSVDDGLDLVVRKRGVYNVQGFVAAYRGIDLPLG